MSVQGCNMPVVPPQHSKEEVLDPAKLYILVVL